MKTNFLHMLARTEPFRPIQEGQIRHAAATFRVREFPAGKVVSADNGQAREIGVIVSGQVSLGLSDHRDRFTRFDILTKGDYLGLETLAIDADSPIKAFCESPVCCYFQSREDFLLMIESLPNVKEYFYKKAILSLAKALHSMNGAGDDFQKDKYRHRASPRFPRSVEKSLIYIEKNYMKSISLDEIASVNNMSKFHFTRVFKRKTGFTFKQYLNKKRIEMAKKFIRYEDMTVSEAGIAVGYNDLAYFSRVFREIEGISPSGYKKNLQ
jgi:AraC-like DNA-binding protein